MSLYATEYHQCSNCGLTRPDKELTKGARRDVVLNLNDTIYACTDPEVCARFKQFREQREKEREQRADKPIKKTSWGKK
jgi:hypothetical protein